jgi:hypothetical protein
MSVTHDIQVVSLPWAPARFDLAGEILRAASQAGAEAIVVARPPCQMNLDPRRRRWRLGPVRATVCRPSISRG